MVQEIKELYAYNRWANQRILSACSALAPEELERDLRSSFPSVLATLGHLLGADWIWLERWNGRSPTGVPEGWEPWSWNGLTQRWIEVEQRRTAFIEELRSPDLQRVVHYRNLQGTPLAAPLWQLLRHVVNHSTYHRGQVVTLLRQLGAPAVSTDLVLYYREKTDVVADDPSPITPVA
jgi:uncharacterized damage-inducible protein DinB